MANTYFQFKQFKIEQANCANKVSTDACVFGAWLNEYLPNSCSVLDVGCGSGLLSLMLGHKSLIRITGIEIDACCAKQAKNNVLNSPWSERIEIREADMRTWETNKKFDIIISNPPFYNNSSQNPNSKKNLARQIESLGPENWKHLLSQTTHNTTIIVLLLSDNDVHLAYRKELSALGFSNLQSIALKDTKNALVKRTILIASKLPIPSIKTDTIVYKEDDQSYSSQFVKLLSNYYLYLG
jgi:tRNA1Val (adenine37-N6)-methyltransferase